MWRNQYNRNYSGERRLVKFVLDNFISKYPVEIVVGPIAHAFIHSFYVAFLSVPIYHHHHHHSEYLHVKILLPKIFVVKHSLVLFAVFIVFMGFGWHSVLGKALPVKISK